MKFQLTFSTLASLSVTALLTSTALTSTNLRSQKSAMHPAPAFLKGNKANSIPFGWRPMHYQQILDWQGFSKKDTWRMRNLKFRMSHAYANGKYGGQKVFLSVQIALTKRGISAANSSGTFADNVDLATMKTVVVPRWVELPKLKTAGFDFVVPFDRGKTFDYSTASRRNLSIQIRIFNNSVGNKPLSYPLDAYQGVQTGRVFTNGLFSGCASKNTGRVPTHGASTNTLFIGATDHRAIANCHKPGVPSILVLGSRAIGGIYIGACRLVNAPLVLLTQISAGSQGATTFRLPIPRDTRLRGKNFYTQMWFYDRGATPTGLFASRGLRHYISPTYPLLFATRHYADGPFATSGSTNRGYGLVLRFDG